MSEVMYVVLISDENEEHTEVHGVFRNEERAYRAQRELESSLHDMIVKVESYEVMDDEE